MRLSSIWASEWFTIQKPPPPSAPELLRITFRAIVGVPAANNDTPEPHDPWLLFTITLSTKVTEPSPPIRTPPPPAPPEHPDWKLPVIRFPRMIAWENLAEMPPPESHVAFAVMTLSSITAG